MKGGEERRRGDGGYREHPVPLLLTLVTMNGEGWPTVLSQLPGDLITAALGLAEHQNPAAIHLLLQQLDL